MLAAAIACTVALAQPCPERGLLDPAYCDADGDLVADAPTDPAAWQDPTTIVVALGRLRDPAPRAAAWQPLLEELTRALGREVVLAEFGSDVAQVAAMRAGEVHVAAFETTLVPFAVNLAGAVPFAVMADADGDSTYTLRWYARRGGGITSVEDIRGKRVAHVSAGSYSGNHAPTALMGDLGLVAGSDYQVVFAGSHERSLLALLAGDVDVALVASSVAERMFRNDQADPATLVLLHESGPIPPTGFTLAHDLAPELAEALRQAFLALDLDHGALRDVYGNVDHFVPVVYRDAWEAVRAIQRYQGVAYTPSNL